MSHTFEDKTKMVSEQPDEFVTAALWKPNLADATGSHRYDHSIKHAPIPKIGKDCC